MKKWKVTGPDNIANDIKIEALGEFGTKTITSHFNDIHEH